MGQLNNILYVEDEPGVVTEVDAIDDPPGEPRRGVVEHRDAVRPR